MIKKKIVNKSINVINDILLRIFGKHWEIILINEFPKCGGSWLKQLIGESLKNQGYLYNKNPNRLPVLRPKLMLQRHWLKNMDRTYKTIVIIRDPRDVYNSFYFHQRYFNPSKVLYHHGIFDDSLNEDENITRYLRFRFNHPKFLNPGFSYIDFWNNVKYKQKNNNILILKYEDLRKNTFLELKNTFIFLNKSVSDKLIYNSIDLCSFENSVKKENKQDERKRHARKGIVGDWKNNFNEESRLLFKNKMGDLLIDMGYEKNYKW